MAAETDSIAGRALSRGRPIVAAALVLVTALAWAWLVLSATPTQMPEAPGAMPGMDGMPDMADMPGMAPVAAGFAPWTGAHAALTFAMWWVMMIGMMLPSAAPMILIFDRISRNNRAAGRPFVPTLLFAGAYLAVWGAFSLLATLAQWGLERAALMTPMLRTASPILGGVLFIAAGLYQFSPLKYACLRQCRSPFAFLMGHWRDGRAGALRLGIRHGLYCLGCCWGLMVLLFVGGVMNLLWVALLAAYVLAEKLLPGGPWIARLGGVAMVGFGAWLMAAA